MSEDLLPSRIILRGLECAVLLGWPATERSQTQTVVIDINIFYSQAIKGCVTDNLADTYCYDDLTQTLVKKIGQREFRLLEHFTYEVYQILKQIIKHDASISVRVKKNPPIPNLTGGIFFYYGDETNAW
jgi:FolB domain-containing protein